MKLKDGFVLRQVAGENVVLASGNMDINAMITLNDTAAFLWKALEQEATQETLEQALMQEYGIDQELAGKAVSSFVEQLCTNGFLA